MSNYPECVRESLDDVFSVVKDEQEYGRYSDEILRSAIDEYFGPIYLQQFFDTGETDAITEEQAEEALESVLVRCAVSKLEQHGLIHIFENEKGEELFAVSEKGKAYMKDLNETKVND